MIDSSGMMPDVSAQTLKFFVGQYWDDPKIIDLARKSTAAMDPKEREKITARDFGGGFTALDAAAVWGEHLANVPTAHAVECTERIRNRIFNLGYYTWVEQQGTPVQLFEARRSQEFWTGLRRYLQVWDDMIDEFNARVAAH